MPGRRAGVWRSGRGEISFDIDFTKQCEFMSTSVPEFSPEELDVVRATLVERYGENVEIELADTELSLDPESPEPVECPTVFWNRENCNFIVCKVGRQKFYCQFFYNPDEQYGTGRMFYDDLFELVATLLKFQTEHALKRRWTFE